MKRHFAIAAACLFVCGCSTLPKFDTIVGPSKGPEVGEIIDHISCELYDSIKVLPAPYYVASVDLTLDVTNDQGISPSLNFITPYSTSGTNFTGVANGKVTGEQHRQFEQSFALQLDPKKFKRPKSCDEGDLAGLRGNLGLKEVFDEGSLHQVGSFPFPDANKDPKTSADLVPVFGTTIDFTVVYGVGGGPTWTLTKFTGPSSDGLITLSRTHKDTLVLSVARLPGEGEHTGSAEEATAAAALAARANSTRMILQRLLGRVQ